MAAVAAAGRSIFRSSAARTAASSFATHSRSPLSRLFHISDQKPSSIPPTFRFSMCSEDLEMTELLQYLDKLKNYEKSGVPKGAGTDSREGFDLDRMHRLLENLGNPQSKFKAVHIAGTKGKGSTAAFLANMLREGGYSVGCYTSPHLLTIRERITFGKKGVIVSPQALNNLFLRLKNVLDQSIYQEQGFLTHFEIFTALAFSFFAEESVDIAIIEYFRLVLVGQEMQQMFYLAVMSKHPS